MKRDKPLEEQLRQELSEARERIIAQLDDIRYVSSNLGFTHFGGGSPNYKRLYGELQDELREINKLLGAPGPENDHL